MRKPLVMVCGIGFDADAWADQIASLSDEAACLPVVARGESIETMAADVLARAPPQFALAGHSLGGYVAMAMQRQAPGRVLSLALLNSSAEADSAAQTAGRLALIDLVASRGYGAVTRRLLAAMVAEGRSDDPALMARIGAMLDRGGPERFIREQRAAVTRPHAAPALHAVAMPTLVIGGAADRILPASHSRDIASLIPGAKLAILEACGHASTLEQPEAVTALLKAWLQLQAGQLAP